MKRYISPSIEVIVTEGIMEGNGPTKNSGEGYIGGGSGDPGGFETEEQDWDNDMKIDTDIINTEWKRVVDNVKRPYRVFDE